MILNIATLLLAAANPNVSAVNDSQAQGADQPKKAKKICKSTTVTGSRLGKRECKTQEQWEQSESGMELGQKGAKGTLAPPQFPAGN